MYVYESNPVAEASWRRWQKLQDLAARRNAEFAAVPEPVVAEEPVQTPTLDPVKVAELERARLRQSLAVAERESYATEPQAPTRPQLPEIVSLPFVGPEAPGAIYRPERFAVKAQLRYAAEWRERMYQQRMATRYAEFMDRRNAQRAELLERAQATVEMMPTPRMLECPQPREYAPCTDRVCFTLGGGNLGVVRMRTEHYSFTFELPVADLDLQTVQAGNYDVQELGARLAVAYRKRTVSHLVPYVNETTWYIVDRDSESHPNLTEQENPLDYRQKQVSQRQRLARILELAHKFYQRGATIEVHEHLAPAFASLIETVVQTWHDKPRTVAPRTVTWYLKSLAQVRPVTKVTPHAAPIGFGEDKYEDQAEDLQAVMVWTGSRLLPALLDANRNTFVVGADEPYIVPTDHQASLVYTRESIAALPRNKKQAKTYKLFHHVEWDAQWPTHIVFERLDDILIRPRGGVAYYHRPGLLIDQEIVSRLHAAYRHWRNEMQRQELIASAPAKRQHIADPNPVSMRSEYLVHTWVTPPAHQPMTTGWVDNLAFYEAEALFDDQFVDQRQAEIINLERIDNYSFTVQGVEPIRSYQDGTLFHEEEEVSARVLHRQRTQPVDTDMVVLRYNVKSPRTFKVYTVRITVDKQTQKRVVHSYETPHAIPQAEAQERVGKGVLAYAIRPKAYVWKPAKLAPKLVKLTTPYSPAAHADADATVYCGPAWKQQEGSPLYASFANDIQRYKQWLRDGFKVKNSPINRELKRLAAMVKAGQPLVLTGWPDAPIDPATGWRVQLTKQEKLVPPAYLKVIEFAVQAIAAQ